MSLSVQLGLLLALLTAFGSVTGFLFKFRGAREAPEVDRRSAALVRLPVFLAGSLFTGRPCLLFVVRLECSSRVNYDWKYPNEIDRWMELLVRETIAKKPNDPRT